MGCRSDAINPHRRPAPHRAKVVAYRTAVHDEMNVARCAAMECGQSGKTADAHAVPLNPDAHGVVVEFRPEHAREAAQETVLRFLLGTIRKRREMFAREGEPDMRMRDGKSLDDLRHSLRFGAVALEKLQSCGGRGEQVRHLDPCACRRGGGADCALDAGLDHDGGGGRVRLEVRVVIARRATAPMDGSASPRKPSVWIAKRSPSGNPRGCVAFDCEREVFRRHSLPVIDDADELSSPRLDGDLDGACPGVDRVLDQLLHGRSRTLDHLAGGNAVDQDRIEAADIHRRVLVRFGSGE